MKPIRLQMTHDLIDSYGLFEVALEKRAPSPISRADLEKVHDPNFIDAVDRLSVGEHLPGVHQYGFGGGDNPVFPGMYEAAMLYCGASDQAAQAVVEGEAEIATNIAGGLHHAHYSKAAGFCVFNDCAVAIRRLRTRYDRVAYVDIDVHHGDGVQELFYKDPSVLTLSLHETGRTLFPSSGHVEEIGEGEGTGYSVNLPFAPYTTEDIWLDAWRKGALPILQAFQPQAIVLQLGADAHYLDPLAHIQLTAQGWLEAIQDVHSLGVPIVALGGGGYNMTTVPRMWTLAVAYLAGAPILDKVPESYAWRAEIPTLTDSISPDSDPQYKSRAAAFARHTLTSVHELLFPTFGLKR